MLHSDFDLPSLARYLHLSPDKVTKLADRGQLPGRKVSGEWKFARADVHHWLERRIGASDEEELLVVEGVLNRSCAGSPGTGRIRSPNCCRPRRSPSRSPRGRAAR